MYSGGSGGSNYDSLFARTVAYPVQVAYWTKEVMAPWGTTVPCQLRPWPWGPVGWWRSLHDRVYRGPACKPSPRAKLESDRY